MKNYTVPSVIPNFVKMKVADIASAITWVQWSDTEYTPIFDGFAAVWTPKESVNTGHVVVLPSPNFAQEAAVKFREGAWIPLVRPERGMPLGEAVVPGDVARRAGDVIRAVGAAQREEVPNSADVLEAEQSTVKQRQLCQCGFERTKGPPSCIACQKHAEVVRLKREIRTLTEWKNRLVDELKRYDRLIPRRVIPALATDRNEFAPADAWADEVHAADGDEAEQWVNGPIAPAGHARDAPASDEFIRNPNDRRVRYVADFEVEFQRNRGRPWNKTERERYGRLEDESALFMFGYSTAQDGPNERQRRELLEDFLFVDLPKNYPRRAHWREPGSKNRLQTLIGFLRWRIETEEKNGQGESADKRRDDLTWLRSTFGSGAPDNDDGNPFT